MSTLQRDARFGILDQALTLLFSNEQDSTNGLRKLLEQEKIKRQSQKMKQQQTNNR